MRTDSLAFRLAVGALIWISGALTISGFMLAAIFDDHLERNFERRIQVLLDSLIAQAELQNGRIVLTGALGEPLFDRRPNPGWYYQISAPDGTVVLKSRSLFLETLDIPLSEATRQRRLTLPGPGGQNLLVLERGIIFPDSDVRYHFVVGADLAQVDREAAPFNRVLGWSLGVLWFGLLVASVVQIHYGLRPLRRVREGLADIRSGRTERLEGRFPAEVTPLADELNAHLDHIAAIVERARTNVGNLAHSLKTPLSVLTNEARAADGPFARTVRRQAEIMGRRVDHYLIRARTAAVGGVLGTRTAVRPVLTDLGRTLVKVNAEKGLGLECEAPDSLHFRGDREDFEEMVGNLMDNACKWARTTVRVEARPEGASLRITVDDDGPGLTPEQRDKALIRGRRLDETVPGTGLGLSIVDEIAELYGGSFFLEESPLSGLRAILVLPRAESV